MDPSTTRTRPDVGPRRLPPLQSERLLDQVRERIRFLHYSMRTEQAYVHWCKAFIRYHGLRHPRELGQAEVEAFLSWLASDRHVAPSTHKQALSALVFLYCKVMGLQLPWLPKIGRPQPKRKLPMVLTPSDITKVLCWMEGEHRLFAQLLYGTGLRLKEAVPTSLDAKRSIAWLDPTILR